MRNGRSLCCVLNVRNFITPMLLKMKITEMNLCGYFNVVQGVILCTQFVVVVVVVYPARIKLIER